MPTPQTDLLHIRYKLTFKTQFHCGTGIREGLIDRTVVRDSGGYLYIPGSSFKGNVRERCEQLSSFYEQASGKQVDPHNADTALRQLGKNPLSMITRIFGSQIFPGKLFFDDAHQSEDDLKQYDSQEQDEGKGKYQNFQVMPYTQVRIDRPTRTAVQGALYTSEFGTRDIVFEGNIQGWLTCIPISELEETGRPAPTYSLLLLLAGLHLVRRLGGNKSTGKGMCECEVVSLKRNDVEYPKDVWSDWLEQLDSLALYEEAVKEG